MALVCVKELDTRSRVQFSTSCDLTDTYGTPGDMSILFLVGRRHGANHAMFEASALHRAQLPSYATYLSVESARYIGTDPCPKHAQPLRTSRARAAGRSLASARPQRVPAGPADRASDPHAHEPEALMGTRCSAPSVRITPASSRRCLRPLSSSSTGRPRAVANRCRTRRESDGRVSIGRAVG